MLYNQIYKSQQVKNAKAGFSLIEIMIVLAIGAMIIAGAFAGFRYLENARVRGVKTKLAQLDTAISQYKTDIGSYPAQLEELIEGPKDPKLRKRWSGLNIKEADITDAWDKQFIYELGRKGAQPPYTLYTTSPKGVDIHSPVSAD